MKNENIIFSLSYFSYLRCAKVLVFSCMENNVIKHENQDKNMQQTSGLGSQRLHAAKVQLILTSVRMSSLTTLRCLSQRRGPSPRVHRLCASPRDMRSCEESVWWRVDTEQSCASV